MDLLKNLKFVRGSVAKKDLLPALTHFRIERGRVQGYNGRIALSAPIAFDVDCTPKAIPLVNAIDRCQEAVAFSLTPSGKLSVKSGPFRTYIECVEGPTPHVQPAGQRAQIDGQALLQALTTLEPFISNDASRPWSNGVLFDGSSAFATNNVIAAEYWLGSEFPMSVTIPREAVKEIIRIGEAPVAFQMSENSLTCHYEDGRWVFCGLIEGAWPNLRKVLDIPSVAMTSIPDEFYMALDSVKPFVDKYGRVMFEPGVIRTHRKDAEEGASVDCEWIKNGSTFAIQMIERLKGVAHSIDLTTYPKPCPWQGERVRGAIIGLHQLEDL